ncbi:cytochrome P450 [Streptomyces xanthochromogenes]|uniref:cytochrome P450 n=1 Tax=Streptomyces xanthochromogenes TaxID=67384 RepID=UPI00343AFC72
MGSADAVEAARLVLALRTCEDQVAVYARLAQLGPVHVMPWKAVVVSDYALCRRVLLDRRCEVLDASWRDRLTPGWRANPSLVAFHSSLLTTNPPRHAPLRGSLTAGLSPGQVTAMRPAVAAAVEGCLDDLAGVVAREGEADLVAVLSERLPGEMLCAWMGLPAHDAPHLIRLARRWSVACELGPTPAQLADADRAYAGLRDYLLPHLLHRSRMPGEDALSQWLVPAPDGGGLDPAAAVTHAALMFLGAKDLTALITSAAHTLLTDASLARRLREDPAAAVTTAEELARRRPPIAVLTRVATAGMRLGDVSVEAGRIVHTLLQPANCGGPPAGNALAFGAGAHYCPGASLTRLCLRTLLPHLARRVPDLSLAAAPPTVEGVVFPRLRSLLVGAAPVRQRRFGRVQAPVRELGVAPK